MRIIFSRKGFDSRYGGVPSPIIDGRPHSLPIPSDRPSPTRFSNIASQACQMVELLTAGRHTGASYCHLDPDLSVGHLPRASNWRGAFGQGGSAGGHLRKQRVSRGDLFLFYGLFQELRLDRKPTYVGPKHHRIFGWLQVGDTLGAANDGSWVLQRYSWLRDHPHARPGWEGFANHMIYVATEQLQIDGKPTPYAGWGHFRDGLALTAPGETASVWRVPPWIHPAAGGVGLTYHPPSRWLPDGKVQSAYPGQEFVADVGNRIDSRNWLLALMEDQAHG